MPAPFCLIRAHPGFTAIVDKKLSAKYETLVARAPELIKDLPWGKDFEVDVFSKPDFTALEVVNFATGGKLHCAFLILTMLIDLQDMPVGINVTILFPSRFYHRF